MPIRVGKGKAGKADRRTGTFFVHEVIFPKFVNLGKLKGALALALSHPTDRPQTAPPPPSCARTDGRAEGWTRTGEMFTAASADM